MEDSSNSSDVRKLERLIADRKIRRVMEWNEKQLTIELLDRTIIYVSSDTKIDVSVVKR